MDQDKPRIGSQIRRLRRAKDITQADLAKRIGLQAPALCAIETCKRDPKAELVVKIAEALGVPIADLFEQPINGTAA